MALGDNNYNNGGNNNAADDNKKYERNYFSRENFKNHDIKRALGFEFWKGMLKVSISEEKQGDRYSTYEEKIYLHLSPAKARILLSEIREGLMKDTTFDTSKAWGVDTGLDGKKSIIAFAHATGSTAERPIYRCTIGKPDSNFNLTSKDVYIFNSNYHYGIQWSDFDKMEYDNSFYDCLELDAFCTVLREYINASSGAIAYSVLDMARFDYNRINTKIDVVMDKLGIPKYNGGGNGDSSYGGGSSQFNKPRGASNGTSNRGVESTSAEEIEEALYA